MKKFAILLLALSVVSLAGCGGGGGGGTSGPVASTDTFQLKTAYLNSLSSSSSTWNLSGTVSSVSGTGSGTIVFSNLTSSTFEGASCLQQTTTLSGNFTANGVTVPFGGTSVDYYDNSYDYLGSSGNTYSVVTSAFNLPDTAKVNDTGIIFVENEYADITKAVLLGTETVSFTIEADTASTAILKLITVEKDLSNNVVSTDITTARITPSGDYTRLTETFTDSIDNFKATFQ